MIFLGALGNRKASHLNNDHIEEPAQKGRAFELLDGMRGIAAISVMIYHYAVANSENHVKGLFNIVMDVDFFFVLSGFVITFAYQDKIMNGMKFSAFALKRGIRLYPTFALGMAISTCAAFWSGNTGWSLAYLLNFLFIPDLTLLFRGAIAAEIFPANPPTWSLSDEFISNIVFFYMIRIRPLFLNLFIFTGLIAFIFLTLRLNSINSGWNWSNYLGGIARVWWSFSIGGVLLKLFQTYKLAIPKVHYLVPCVALIGSTWFPHVSVVYNILIVTIMLPLIVILAAKSSVTSNISKVCAYLGQTSYTIYVLHIPLFWCFRYIFGRFTTLIGDHYWVSTIIMCFLTIGLCHVVDMWIDLPVRAFLSSAISERTVRAVIIGPEARDAASPAPLKSDPF